MFGIQKRCNDVAANLIRKVQLKAQFFHTIGEYAVVHGIAGSPAGYSPFQFQLIHSGIESHQGLYRGRKAELPV